LRYRSNSRREAEATWIRSAALYTAAAHDFPWEGVIDHRTLACAALCAASVTAALVADAQDAPPLPELVVQTGHQQQVDVVAFSADSRMLASGDIRGSIRIWETAAGKQLWALPGHRGAVSQLRFSRDGQFLASAGTDADDDGAVKIWEVASGRELRSFALPGFRLTDLEVSADGNLVAAAGDVVRIWSIVSGEQVDEISTDNYRATLAFEPRGQLLAVRDPSRVRFWSPSGLETESIKLQNVLGERDMAFLSDGQRLAVPDGDRVVIVDVPKRRAAGRIVLGETFPFGLPRVFPLPDSNDEIVVNVRDRYEVWDLVEREKVREIARREGSTDEFPSPSWQLMAVRNQPTVGALQIEDLAGGREPVVLGGHTAAAGAVAFSPDGAQLATKMGRRFWVWDLESGEPRLFDGHRTLGERGFEIDSLSFASGGARLISTDPLSGLIEWDIAAGEISNAIAVPRGEQSALVHACSLDGRWCVSGDRDRIEVRNVATWRVDRTFDAGAGRGVAISDDGSWIATPVGNVVSIWDRRNGRARVFEGHNDVASRVAFSPGGRLLASADFSGIVKVWDVESGREQLSFQTGHTGITSLAFSPDSRVLATGGSDPTIRLWDPGSGQLRHTLEGHADWIPDLDFNPTGRLLASGSADGTIRIWDVESGAAVALLTAARDSADWLVVTPDGHFDGSAGAEGLVAWRIGTAAYPPERYFNNFFQPGLLANVVRGGTPAARVALDGITVPPLIRILESGGRVLTKPKLSVRMRVEGEVEEVNLYHNGARIASRPGTADATAEYAFDLELIPGENELRGVAVSPSGVTSNPDAIRITYDAPAAARPALHVLTIGVSRYQQPSWNLGFARADAEAIAAFFRDHSAKLFETVNTTVLADENASRANIQAAIESIGAQAQDVVLVYFAGHGVALDQTYYLLPHEMRDETSLEADVRKFGLSDRALLDSLRSVKALKKVVILDACQSGGALDILGRAPAAERAALEMLVRAEGLFIVAASTRQQEAIEVSELGHGVLTYALLSGLGATNDPSVPAVVTMHQLLTHISRKVPELAVRYGRTTRQVPVSFHRGMDFPLTVR
jgi:WD40 repeat protein